MSYGLIHSLLFENTSPEDIRNKFYSDIPENVFNNLAKIDPSSRIKDGKLLKLGKYAKFLLKLYKLGEIKFEDAPRYTEYLGLYHKYKNNPALKGVDIMTFNSFSDLMEAVNEIKSNLSGDVIELAKELLEFNQDYKHIFTGKDWIVLQPLTEKGSCVLGFGSDWCTAWGSQSLDKSKQNRSNHFSRYSDELYILISKANNKPIWQISFNSNQFMDINDKNLFDRSVGGYDNAKDFFEKNTELVYPIFPEVKKFISEGGIKGSSLFTVLKYLPDNIVNKITEKYDDLIDPNIVTILNGIDFDGELDDINQKLGKVINDINVSESDRHELGIDSKYFDDSFANMVRYASMRDGYQNYDGYGFDDDTAINTIEYALKTIKPNSTKFPLISTHLKPTSTIKDLKKLLGMKYYEEYMDSSIELLNEKESEHIGNSHDQVKDKIGRVWEYKYNNNITLDPELLIRATKSYIISYDYETVDFKDLVEYISVSYDIPADEHEYFDWVNNDHFDATSAAADLLKSLEDKLEEIDPLDDIVVLDKNLEQKLKDLGFDDDDTVENEIGLIQIKRDTINYDDSTIEILFNDKKNGKSYDGRISIDNLGSYVTNYKLFETIHRIKKIATFVS